MAGAALPAAISPREKRAEERVQMLRGSEETENRAGGHADENDEGLSGSNQAGQHVLEGVELKPD